MGQNQGVPSVLARTNRVSAGLASLLLVGAASLALSSPAKALTINPTFGSTITSDPNAAAIEGVINTAIGVYQSKFTDPINVAITFNSMSTGLGSSSTLF
jgi:hypothetical protein